MKNLLKSILFCFFALGIFYACKLKSSGVSGERALVFARPGDSVGLDLAKQDEGESINIGINILECLAGFELGGTKIEPRLAEKWDISKDGKTYTFYLRKNVKFHDGTPMNADAVVFSFERQWKKEHPAYAFGAPYKYWLNVGMDDIVKEVQKVDDLTVKIILKQPNAPFLANIAMPFLSIVSPTAVMKHKEGFDQNPVGTGPYTLKSWKKDDAMVLEAFADYWGEKAKINKVVVRVIPDNQVRVLELQRGSIHLMDFPNPADLSKLAQDSNVTLLKSEGLNVGYLAFNMKKKPLDKLEVREAISMGIDRKRLLSEIYQGMGALASNPIPPMVLGYNSRLPEISYDPVKAKALLEKAGITGLKIDLWAMPVARPYNPNAKKMAEFIQSDLKKIGIDATIVSYDWGTYLDKAGKGEHELLLMGWNGDNGDPDNFLYTLLAKDVAQKIPTQNFSFWMNDEFTKLIKEAQIITEAQKRAALYSKAIEIFAKDKPWLPIAHSVVVVPMRNEIEGYKIDPIAGNRWFASVQFKDAPKQP